MRDDYRKLIDSLNENDKTKGIASLTESEKNFLDNFEN